MAAWPSSQPDGQFTPIDFPEGSGQVTERRYETMATLSRPLASNVDLQVLRVVKSRGWTGSTMTRAPRIFRPKGSVVLGWKPAKGWDISLKARRKVGQISFYDFLASQSSTTIAKMPVIPTSCRRKAGSWKPRWPRTRTMGQDPAERAIITGSRTSSTSFRLGSTRRDRQFAAGQPMGH